MLSSLFAITAVLASFVAANPILAPRAASDPFILFAPIGQDNQYLRLEMKPVANTKYYEFGWFGSGSEDVKLYFLNDEEKPGPVFDNRKNKYEMYVSPLLTSGVYLLTVSKGFPIGCRCCRGPSQLSCAPC